MPPTLRTLVKQHGHTRLWIMSRGKRRCYYSIDLMDVYGVVIAERSVTSDEAVHFLVRAGEDPPQARRTLRFFSIQERRRTPLYD